MFSFINNLKKLFIVLLFITFFCTGLSAVLETEVSEEVSDSSFDEASANTPIASQQVSLTTIIPPNLDFSLISQSQESIFDRPEFSSFLSEFNATSPAQNSSGWFRGIFRRGSNDQQMVQQQILRMQAVTLLEINNLREGQRRNMEVVANEILRSLMRCINDNSEQQVQSLNNILEDTRRQIIRTLTEMNGELQQTNQGVVALRSLYDQLTGQVDGVNENVNGAREEITGVQNGVNNVQTEVVAARNDIVNLQQTVHEIREQVNFIGQRLKWNPVKIASVTTAIMTLVFCHWVLHTRLLISCGVAATSYVVSQNVFRRIWEKIKRSLNSINPLDICFGNHDEENEQER